MANAETLNVTLPEEVLVQVRQAVATGEYDSSNEVIHDALQEWSLRRSLELNADHVKHAWQEALADHAPHVPMDDVFDRLEARYKAIAAAEVK